MTRKLFTPFIILLSLLINSSCVDEISNESESSNSSNQFSALSNGSVKGGAVPPINPGKDSNGTVEFIKLDLEDLGYGENAKLGRDFTYEEFAEDCWDALRSDLDKGEELKVQIQVKEKRGFSENRSKTPLVHLECSGEYIDGQDLAEKDDSRLLPNKRSGTVISRTPSSLD